jgi:5'-nucleotidase
MLVLRLRHASVLALGLLAALAAIPASRGADNEKAAEKKLTLLYTTDVHGHYHPHKDEKSGSLYGGFAALDAKVREVRAQSKVPVFLFDSGDIMTGHPICDLENQGVLGGALFRMMNAIGYDAWCIGNHDFDHGRANTSKLLELAKFPTLSANLTITGDPPLKIERWKILEKDGIKVGVFGLMTESLAQVTGKEKIAGITVTSAAVAAREAVAALQSKCDLIVALSHCGSDEDVKLADEVHGIDVILSGHNHKPLKPQVHGKTIVTEGVLKAEKLGFLNLTFHDGHWEYLSDFLRLDAKEPTGDVKTVLDEVQSAIGAKLDEVLAKLEVPWKREYHYESNIGDFLAEAMRTSVGADVGFLNAGGIRKNQGLGNITVGDVDEMLIDGDIVRFELSGADLLRGLEQNAAVTGDERAYGLLQVAGVRYEFKHNGRSATIVNATVGGQPIDPKKTYSGATTDFIAVDQREKYFGKGTTFTKVEKTGKSWTKAAEDYVREQGKNGPIKVDVDGRMKEVK